MAEKARTPGKFANQFMAALLRSPLHGILSQNMLVITVKGRKSGKTYSTPVNYARDGSTLYATSYRERSWWRNLRGGAPVTVRLQGKDVPGRGEVIEDEAAVAAALAAYFGIAPAVAKYFNVSLGAGDRPNPDDLARAAQSRVVVRIQLQ